jgi:hypothetical protein
LLFHRRKKFIRRRSILPPATAHFAGISGASRAALARSSTRHGRDTRASFYRPRPEDDPEQRRPDISRAQELLDWKWSGEHHCIF